MRIAPPGGRVSLLELAARLNAAAEAGAAVRVRYALGSRTTAHQVVPVAATATVLRARDLDAGRTRVFLLQHLELVDAPTPAPAPPPPPLDEQASSAHERLAALVRPLTSLGWHVKRSGEALGIHKPGPDGTPLSVAAASIRRNVGTAVTTRLVRRPWSVVAPGLVRRQSFASLEQAIALFLRQAAEYAPAFRRRRRIS